MSTAVEARRRDEGLAKTGLLAVLGSEAVFFGTRLTAYLFLAQPAELALQKVGLSQPVAPGLNTGILLLSALVISAPTGRSPGGIGRGCKPGCSWSCSWERSSLQGSCLSSCAWAWSRRSGLRGGLLHPDGVPRLARGRGDGDRDPGRLAGSSGDFSAHRHIAVQVSAWFWYFVTAVWS